METPRARRLKPRTERYIKGLRKKLPPVTTIYQLVNAYHPQFGIKQKWYVETVRKGQLIALIQETRHQRVILHSAIIAVPQDAPYEPVSLLGIAAAMGLAKVEYESVKKKLLPMPDHLQRLWEGSIKHPLFRGPSSKWVPALLSETVGNLSNHGCWPIVTGWDLAVVTSSNLEKLQGALGIPGYMRNFKQRLRTLKLPCSDWEYVSFRLRVFGVSEFNERLISILSRPVTDTHIRG